VQVEAALEPGQVEAGTELGQVQVEAALEPGQVEAVMEPV
jgi:hypothetical protein